MTTVGKRLTVLAVLSVAGAASVYLALWQEGRIAERSSAKAADEKVTHFDDVGKVSGIVLRTPSETFTLTRHEDSTWQITEPLPTAADDTVVDGLLRHLVDLRRTHLVGAPREDARSTDVQPPDDLGLFGLSPARFQIELTLDDGKAETLLIGKKNSFDGSVYVKQQEEPHIVMVPGAIEYQVDKQLFDLREKRVAVFQSEEVKKITVELPVAGRSYSLEKSEASDTEDSDSPSGNAQWMLTAPVSTRADGAQVGGMLSALSNLRAKAFVSERGSPDDVAAYGLAAPVARVSLYFRDTNEPLVVVIGRRGGASEASPTAMREGRGPIAELASDWGLRKVEVEQSELRDKRLMHFSRDAVSGIEITRSDGTALTFERRSNANDGDAADDATALEATWWMTRPTEAEAQQSMVAGLLYKLWSMEAERVVAEIATEQQRKAHGLDTTDGGAPLLVRLTDGEGREMGRFIFGNQEGSARYATTSVGGRLDLVDHARIEEIALSPDDYVENTESAPGGTEDVSSPGSTSHKARN